MTDKLAKKVALLVGGWSAEREVSLTKGKKVEAGLLEAGYDVDVIDVTKDIDAIKAALTPKPDVVFNNLHGRGGEDGTIQGILDVMEIPYTHSGLLASAVAMDKAMTKRLAGTCGVLSPQWAVMPLNNVQDHNPVPAPFVIKPVNEGSSVGVYIVEDKSLFSAGDINGLALEEDVLIEQYIPGRELTVAVLDGQPQGVTEIVSKTKFFDYAAKYSDQRTEYVLPADIPEQIYNKALDNAAQIFKLLECQGLARCDFRYNDTRQGPEGLYFLEINTQPGLTAESIGPSQVIHNGKTFPELCAHLVETALKRHSQCPQNQKGSKTNNPTSADKAEPASSPQAGSSQNFAHTGS